MFGRKSPLGPWIGFLLLLYPRAYRDKHHAELGQSYSDILQGQGRSLSTWVWLFWDALSTSVRIRNASRAAHRQPGNMATTKGERMRGFGRELALAVRSLLRAPGFAAVVIVTMGLGLGANTAVFSVAYRVLLAPLPYEQPGNMVWIQNRYLPEGTTGAVSAPEYFELRQSQPALSAMSVIGTEQANLTGLERPVRLNGLAVSPGFFSMLGHRPLLGRGFLPEEEEPGGSQVAILSHGLWQSAFGSDAQVLGRQIQLDGQSVNVVGIMGPQYESLSPLLYPGRRNDFWQPLAIDPATFDERTVERHGLSVVGRLSDGSDIADAERGLLDAVHRIEAQYPGISNEGSRDMAVIPLRQRMAGDSARLLLLLSTAVGLILVLACLNVTNMLVARAEARWSEVTIRAALGAGRRQLLAHGLAESVVIGITAGAVGVGFTFAVLEAMPFLTEDLALLAGGHLGFPVLVFSFLLSLATGLLAGVLPAIRTAKGAVFNEMKGGGGRGPARRSHQNKKNALVVAQIAGTVVLVSSASLVLQSLVGIRSVDPGFRAQDLHLVEINAMRSDYPTYEAVRAFFGAIESQLEAVPGIHAVAASWQTPLQTGMSDWPVMAEGSAGSEWHGADPNWVSPSYFETYGISLVSGRLFDGSDLDREQTPVVLSESAARTLWPDGDAVGRRVTVDFSEPIWRDVIGVVQDIQGRGLDLAPRPQTYLTFAAGPFGPTPNLTLTVRSALGVEAIRQHVTGVMARVDSNVPLGPIVSMESQVAETILEERVLSVVLTFLGLLSIILGSLGVYGLVAYVVETRRREFGLRIAMGAERTGVLKLVLSRGASLALIGTGVGLFGSMLSGRLLEGFLFGVSGTDMGTLLVAGGVVMGAALLASYWPARRAAGLDPLVLLQAD